MVGSKEDAHWWWIDSHIDSKGSPWLKSTLQGLNEKTKEMLKIIEQNADTFAQRAEMYYKKRPELVHMVEEFYREHRSLAEQFDLLKSESRLTSSSFDSPFSSAKQSSLDSPFSSVKRVPHDSQLSAKFPGKPKFATEKSYDSLSECFGSEIEDIGDSDIDDPDQDQETQFKQSTREETEYEVVKFLEAIASLREETRIQRDELARKDANHEEITNEVIKTREVIARLQEENRVQRDELKLKDSNHEEIVNEMIKMREVIASLKDELVRKDTNREEIIDEMRNTREEIERLKENVRISKDELKEKDEGKREVIRQLSVAVDIVKEENMKLKKFIATVKKNGAEKSKSLDFNKVKGLFLERWFNGSSNSSRSRTATASVELSKRGLHAK